MQFKNKWPNFSFNANISHVICSAFTEKHMYK